MSCRQQNKSACRWQKACSLWIIFLSHCIANSALHSKARRHQNGQHGAMKHLTPQSEQSTATVGNLVK